MKEYPISFSGPMVRATLEGRKCQTRRVIKQAHTPINYKPPVYQAAASMHQDGAGTGWIAWFPKPVSAEETKKLYPGADGFECPYGQPGDRLWVRESFYNNGNGCCYMASESIGGLQAVRNSGFVWRGSIHMPRWASRIILEITNVRVERVREISEADAQREGWFFENHDVNKRYDPVTMDTARRWFNSLWDSIYSEKGYGWDVNPWVWVIEFKVAP